MRSGLIKVNGADIYHEIRGRGPSVIMVMGASGDGGHFDAVAALLARNYTVVTYDRRGNGRSPRPPGWTATSNEEQADDAAALVDHLGLAPVLTFGTSLGATYALYQLIRHPHAVRGAILHEPALYAVLDNPNEVLAPVAPLLQEALEAGGPSAFMERFWRWVAGDSGWDYLEPSLRQRMLGTAATFCDIERGTYETQRPTDEALAAITTPMVVLCGQRSPAFRHQMAQWLADRLQVPVHPAPNGHTPYVAHAAEFAQTLSPLLQRLNAATR
jgi:pimeloyl-ACP methyl ester carboxylesterase